MFRTRRRTRSGTAAAETAVVMPVVILVMLGSIELCGGVHQQVRARAVLHECSKVAAKGESTSSDVLLLAKRMFQPLEVTNFVIQIDVIPRTVNQASVAAPTVTKFLIASDGTATPGFDELPRGTLLRMSLTADRPPLGAGLTRFMGSDLEANSVFVKEI